MEKQVELEMDGRTPDEVSKRTLFMCHLLTA